MGRSVYLIAPANARSMHAQLRRLNDQFGEQNLKLEGPFADKDGAIADIADRVRMVSRFNSIDLINATMVMLKPQNKLPKDEQPSLLDAPFIADSLPLDGWQSYPESAGETASRGAVEYEGGWARIAEPTDLNVLAVSVLRRLKVECYFAMAVCRIPDETVTRAGIQSGGIILPAIIWPSGSETRTFSIIPKDNDILAASSSTSFEAMDDDAILSLITLKNAHKHAKSLMADIAKRQQAFEGERPLRCMEIGHMVHNAVSLWTLPEAQEDIGRAKGMLGPGKLEGIESVRERIGQSLVRTITDPKTHAMAAAAVMLPEDLRLRVRGYAEGKTSMNLLKFLETVSNHPAMSPFREYLSLSFGMNDHLHHASECKASKGATA